MTEISKSPLYSRLLHIFHKVDADSSGFVDKAELIQGIQQNGEIKELLKESRALSGLLLTK